MDKEKLIEVIKNVDKKSNIDLKICLTTLKEEFEKTKELILSLTRHMDIVENDYNKILKEISKRGQK